MKLDLLEKTELRFHPIGLHGVDLSLIAATVAEALGLKRDEAIVIDAINETLSIDLLCKTIDPYAIFGKKKALLNRLKQIPNIEITDQTTIHSEGILGWIAMDEEKAETVLRISEKMALEIGGKLSKRVVIFSTGSEVIAGQIVDTNQPAIAKAFREKGYAASHGPALKDDPDDISGMIRQAILQEGYGLVITTGGVGAESKDHSIEALKRLDPDAATPYICKFEQGRGRHAKDGVRIGVGEHEGTMIVALPGPNDEVRASLPIVMACLEARVDKHAMAERVARRLRAILRIKMGHGQPHKNHGAPVKAHGSIWM